jgi:glycosyltransferase involved in cell wall biosynthesis
LNLNEAVESLGVQNVYIVHRDTTAADRLRRYASMIRGLISEPSTPLTMMPYNQPRVRRAVSSFLCEDDPGYDDALIRVKRRKGQRWGKVVYDGLHCAIHAASAGIYRRSSKGPQVIYRAHNREADIWRRKAGQMRAGPLRSFLSFQADRVRMFENSLLAAASGVATVSPDDLEAFACECRLPASRVVPIGYDFSEIESFPDDGARRIMFLGRLDWQPNQEGLRWFLEKIWPSVSQRRNDLRLTIAGSGNSEWLESYRGLANVEVLGRVDDVRELYESSMLCLVPVFYGSGTRVKVIEASRYCRPCLSTALGVEGTGMTSGDHYLRAETESQWIEQIVQSDPGKLRQLGRAAFAKLSQTFAINSSARVFADLVEAI